MWSGFRRGDRRRAEPANLEDAGGTGVVPHTLQTLIPSSGCTTPLKQISPPTRPAWCLTPCKPLFLRLEAPRPQPKWRRRRDRRGASSPANPCSFVRRHHALSPNSSSAVPGGRGPYSFLLPPQDRAGPLRGSSADAAGTIRGNEIGLWMTADTFCQLSQSP